MRKITKEAVAAFIAGREYHNDNTAVYESDREPGVWFLQLHGNEIAKRRGRGIHIRTCGWFTTTTKERLNGIPGVQVYSNKRVPHLSGKPWENHEEWTEVKP